MMELLRYVKEVKRKRTFGEEAYDEEEVKAIVERMTLEELSEFVRMCDFYSEYAVKLAELFDGIWKDLGSCKCWHDFSILYCSELSMMQELFKPCEHLDLTEKVYQVAYARMCELEGITVTREVKIIEEGSVTEEGPVRELK